MQTNLKRHPVRERARPHLDGLAQRGRALSVEQRPGFGCHERRACVLVHVAGARLDECRPRVEAARPGRAGRREPQRRAT